MPRLDEASCESCHADAPKLSPDELLVLQAEIPDWELIESESVKQLKRVYSFANFASALAFTNIVGEAAEKEGHHPALLVEWGRVTVHWWTHEIGGLHKNDVIMAAKTEALFKKFST